MVRRFAPVVAVVAVSACASLAGLDEYGTADTTGSGGSGGTSSGTGPGGDGGDAEGCPPDPSGWQGPVAVYRGADDPPACDDPWVLAVEGGLMPMPGSCTCDCDITSNVAIQAEKCATVPHDVEWSTSTNCGMAVFAAQGLVMNTCVNPPPPDTIVSVQATATALPEPGLCNPSDPMGVRGPPTYAENIRICAFTGSADDPALCERPVPSGYPARLCVFKTGDTPDACPGGYTERQLVATEIVDESTCSCSCTENGITCDATVELHFDTNCNDDHQSAPADGVCHPIAQPGTFPRLRIGFNQATGTCGEVKDVTGQADAIDHVTLCCEQ